MSFKPKNQEQWDRMVRGRTQLLLVYPFYGAIALQQKLIEDYTEETAYVDGTHLGYNPNHVATLNEAEIVFLWAHEVCHLTLLHHTRRGSRDLGEWNVACDFVINPRLIRDGLTMPRGMLHDTTYADWSAEQVYAHRKAQQPPPQPPQPDKDEEEDEQDQGEDGDEQAQGGGDEDGDEDGDQGGGNPGQDADGDGADGQGQGQGQGQGGSDPGGWGGVRDAVPEGTSTAEVEAATEAMVRQAIAVAAKGAGFMSDSLQQTLNDLNRPRIDWREEFGRFIDSVAASQPTWNRLDRRMQALGYNLPGRTPDLVEDLVVFRDTSGSTIDAARAFAGEIQGMLDAGRVQRIHVVDADDRVQSVAVYELGDTVQKMVAVGMGGTRFDKSFEWLAANVPDAAAVVYLTDLDVFSHHWGQDPAIPVLWAVTGRKREAPFGEIIPIDPYQ